MPVYIIKGRISIAAILELQIIILFKIPLDLSRFPLYSTHNESCKEYDQGFYSQPDRPQAIHTIDFYNMFQLFFFIFITKYIYQVCSVIFRKITFQNRFSLSTSILMFAIELSKYNNVLITRKQLPVIRGLCF